MYKLTVAYDGTRYSGWQVQPNGISIQQLLQDAASTVLRQPISITGSGRTDAGVHALAQVAHFAADNVPDDFILSLNGILPPDIRVKTIEEAAPDFHARYLATGKIYHYHVTPGSIDDPFRRLWALHFPFPCNLELIEEAAHHLIGTHNFTSFANEGGAAKDKVRTIRRIDLVPETHGFRLEFEGNGFLYKMVRNIVGTLLEVARGKKEVSEIPKILAACDRRAAGQAAPPHGLFLVEVIY